MEANETNVKPKPKKGLGIVSIIMGVISILCCFCVGLGVIPAIIGVVFGVLGVLKCEGTARTLAIVGLVLSGIGMIMSLYVLISIGIHVNWDNVTMENLKKINDIDKDNQQLTEWLKQFFDDSVNVDSYMGMVK